MFPQSSSSVVLMNLLVGKRSSVEPQRVSANVALGSQCCIRASLYYRGQNCKTYDLWFLVLSRMDVDSLSLSLLLSPPPSLCLCLCLSLSVSVCLCLSVSRFQIRVTMSRVITSRLAVAYLSFKQYYHLPKPVTTYHNTVH